MVGKRLVLGFCAWECVALLAEDLLPAQVERIPTLSTLVGRYRSCWPGRLVIGGLSAWLAFHLFLDDLV